MLLIIAEHTGVYVMWMRPEDVGDEPHWRPWLPARASLVAVQS